jgi:hypothetical protein
VEHLRIKEIACYRIVVVARRRGASSRGGAGVQRGCTARRDPPRPVEDFFPFLAIKTYRYDQCACMVSVPKLTDSLRSTIFTRIRKVL